MTARQTCMSFACAFTYLAACSGNPAELSSAAYAGPQTYAPPVAAAVDCARITTAYLNQPRLLITQSQTVAAERNGVTAADNYPEHCQITGQLDARTGSDGQPYAIGFELRLPRAWSQRFVFQGGAATDGVAFPALGIIVGTPSSSENALARGFAVVTMDAGHTGQDSPAFIGGALFGLDPQAPVDYGYHALGEVTAAAKQNVERVYGKPIVRSYFMGCSNGGRQAMVAAARFADAFDGIIAGDPGFQLPKAAVQHAWDYQQFSAVDSDTPSQAFSSDELAYVGERVLARCDLLDGASDGMVSDMEGCSKSFDLGRDVAACDSGRRTG